MANTKTASKKPASKKTVSKKTASKKVSKPKREPKLKVFCGITQPVPKKHRIGTMKECLDKKQVRYYGLKKIDTKLADSINVKVENKNELMIKIASLRGKLTRLKRDAEMSKNVDEKKKIAQEYDITRKDMLKLNEKLLSMK